MTYEDSYAAALQQLKIHLAEAGDMDDTSLRILIADLVAGIHRESYLSLRDRSQLSRELYSAVRGYDVLQSLIDDDSISEIMVNGPDRIFVERRGIVEPCPLTFSSEARLLDVIGRIVGSVNRVVNESTPIVDARLPDGSRVNAVLPPVALDGPILTIRKFPKQALTMSSLIARETLTKEAAEFLAQAVRKRRSILIGGGTSAGKTTFLNALTGFIPKSERIVTIEDNAELQIQGVKNLVRMEAKKANMEGAASVPIRDLIRASLRMRPERIVVGEVRGEEVVDLLQALNTGHEGSLSTVHANSAYDMISRLETMVLMALPLPLTAIRRQIASGVHLIVYLMRLPDGRRRLVTIAEITGMKDGEVCMRDLFRYDRDRDVLERVG